MQFIDDRFCFKCGKPIVARERNAHVDLPAPALVCDKCLKTERLACDFCNVTPTWEFPCAAFSMVPQYQYISTENWLACDRCALLVTLGNYGALSDICAAIARNEYKGDRRMIEFARRFSLALHARFKRFRRGEPWRIDQQGNRV